VPRQVGAVADGMFHETALAHAAVARLPLFMALRSPSVANTPIDCIHLP
jgi:hypothetical protein